MSTPYLKELLAKLPEPKLVWKHFLNVTQIPRGSNLDPTSRVNSVKIQTALKEWTKSMGYEPYQDIGGNIIVRKPASKGFEKAPSVCVQCHMDMVTSAAEGVKIDFLKDPITPFIDGEWVRAKGTSLGADDGVGLGAALALLEDKTLIHGPLEVLITRDEETGMYGAESLEEGVIKSKLMINIDSEEENSVCIGCAGGFTVNMTLPIQRVKNIVNNLKFKHLTVKNLQGGHTGVDIDKDHLSAIKVFGRMLVNLNSKIYLVKMNCGEADNAIPSICDVIIGFLPQYENEINTVLNKQWEHIKEEYTTIEPNMTFLNEDFVDSEKKIDSVICLSDTIKIFNFLNIYPFGPIRFSPNVKGLVETSLALPIINTSENDVVFVSSARSSSNSQMEWLYDYIKSICDLSGITLSERIAPYPGWLPEPECALTKIVVEQTKLAYNCENPKVYAIHAGLECGLFQSKIEHLECTSIGPTVNNPHWYFFIFYLIFIL